jgi:chromosome segregation ATPase
MERLLAYEGPVVHVDHAHRAPAPTSFSTREVAEERKECNRHIQKIHDDHKANTAWEKNRIKELQQQLLDKDDALLRERRHKEMAKVKHEEMVKQMVEAEDGRMKAEEDCDHTVAELHNKYTRAAEGDADEMVKLQRALKAQEEELARARFMIEEMKESELSRSKVIDGYYKEVTELKDELAEDNQNYTKLLNGAYNEAKSKFVFAHAMARSEAEDGDPVALQYIRWVQKKLAELPEMDEDKARASVGMWF